MIHLGMLWDWWPQSSVWPYWVGDHTPRLHARQRARS